MKLQATACILGLALILALATGALAQEKGFLWDGTHWQLLTNDTKVAYVKGIGNMADFEMGVGIGSSRAACISKAFVDELQTKTLGQVVEEVDKFYQDNLGKLNTPVIEVILRRCTKLCPPEASTPKPKK
ncbi:MAG: hypothetical protein ACLFUU_12400 [Desulfobacteraceae bacterium]